MDSHDRFDALFNLAYAPLRRYAHHRSLSGADADDLVAEVLLIAWRRLDVVPVDDPIPWLFAVARNVRRNHERSLVRHRRLVERLPRPLPVDPPDYDDGEDARTVRAALAQLSPDDRELLVLHAWDELAPQQIAVVLECSPGAARVRLHRARNRLAALLDVAVTPTPLVTDLHESTAQGGACNVQA